MFLMNWNGFFILKTFLSLNKKLSHLIIKSNITFFIIFLIKYSKLIFTIPSFKATYFFYYPFWFGFVIILKDGKDRRGWKTPIIKNNNFNVCVATSPVNIMKFSSNKLCRIFFIFLSTEENLIKKKEGIFFLFYSSTILLDNRADVTVQYFHQPFPQDNFTTLLCGRHFITFDTHSLFFFFQKAMRKMRRKEKSNKYEPSGV